MYESWDEDTARAVIGELRSIRQVIDDLAAAYPRDVFPMSGESREAAAGGMARHTCQNIAINVQSRIEMIESICLPNSCPEGSV